MANTLNGPQTPNKRVGNRNGSTPISFGLGFLPSFRFESPSTLLDSISPRGFFQASVSLGKVTENLKEESEEDRGKNVPQLEVERKRDSGHLTPTAKADEKRLKRNGGHISRQNGSRQDHLNDETESSQGETVEDVWSLNENNKGNSSMFTSIYEAPESELLESTEILGDIGQSCSEISPKKLTEPVSEIVVNDVGPEGDGEDGHKHRRSSAHLKGTNNTLTLCNQGAKPTDAGNDWNSGLDKVLLELLSEIKNSDSDGTSTSETGVKTHIEKLSKAFRRRTGIMKNAIQIKQRIVYLRGANDRKLSNSEERHTVETRLQNLLDTDLSDIVDHKDDKNHDTARNYRIGAQDNLHTERQSINGFDPSIKANFSDSSRDGSSTIPALLVMNDSNNKREIIKSLLLSKTVLKCRADQSSIGVLLKEKSVGMILNDSLIHLISKNDIPFWKIDSKLNLKPNNGMSDSTLISSSAKNSTRKFEDYGVSTFLDIKADKEFNSPPQSECKCVTSVFKNHKILLQNQDTIKGFRENTNQDLKFRIPFLREFWTGLLTTLEDNSDTAATLRSLFIIQRIYSNTSPGENSLCAVIAHEFDVNSESEGCALATRIQLDYQSRTDADDTSRGTVGSLGDFQKGNNRYNNIIPKTEPFPRPNTRNKLTLNVAKSKSRIPDRGPLSAPPERGYVPSFHNNFNLLDKYFNDPMEQHFAMSHPSQSQNNQFSTNHYNVMKQNASFEQSFEASPVPLRPKGTPDLSSLQQLPPNLMGDFMKYSPERNQMFAQNSKGSIRESSGNFVDVANSNLMTSTPLKIPGEMAFKMPPPPSYIHHNVEEGAMQSNQHRIMSTPSRSNYMNHNMGEYYPYSNLFYNIPPTFQDPFGGQQDRPLMHTQPHTRSFELYPGVNHDPTPNVEGRKHYNYPSQKRPLSESNREKHNSKGITFCQILEYDPSKDSRNNMRKTSSKKGTGVHKFPVMTPVNIYKPKK